MDFSLKTLLPPLDLGWNRVRARCGLRTCHNKLLTRAVPQSRAGIHVGNLWYCTPDCFAASMRTPLLDLMTRRVTEMPRSPRLPLGLAMFSKGFLTEHQLREVTLYSERHGKDAESTLVELGLADEQQLVVARATQWGYPVLAHDASGLMVRAGFPLTWMRGYESVPLHYALAARRLVLGFVRRVDHSLLQAIEKITGCRADPCFLTPTEYQQQLRRVTAAAEYEEIVVQEPGTPERIARMLGGFAVEVAARQAEYAACNSWIWVRVSGKRKTVDVLFARKPSAAIEWMGRSVPERNVTAGWKNRAGVPISSPG